MSLYTETSLMTRLRDETAELHREAESQPLEQAMVRGTVSRDTMIRFLEQRLLIHAALEAAVLRLVGSDRRVSGLNVHNLFQQRNLEQDLRFFRESDECTTALPATQRFLADLVEARAAGAVALLGSYYVFEGSKNGSRFIAKALRGAFKTEQDGMRYLDPHGDDQPRLWAEFKAAMDDIAFSDGERDGIVAAAKRTFSHIIRVDEQILFQNTEATKSLVDLHCPDGLMGQRVGQRVGIDGGKPAPRA